MPNILAKLAAYRQQKEDISSPPNINENKSNKFKRSRRWQVMDNTFEWKMAWIFAIVFIAMLFTCTNVNAGEKESNEEAHVPIIMYHLITEKSRYIGSWGIRPADLRQDFEFLKQNGYNTVVIADLINFIENGTPLPEKPIVLTFDDGNYSDYKYLFPLLQEFEMKAVISIIGAATDKITSQHAENPNGTYPNLTWGQVEELHRSGLIEVQSHGYDVHKKAGAGKLNKESVQAYHARLLADLQKLDNLCKKHLDYTPNTFCYPYGIISKESQAVLNELGYSASLSCQEGMNIIRYGERDDLFKLKRVNRASGRSVESILAKLKR